MLSSDGNWSYIYSTSWSFVLFILDWDDRICFQFDELNLYDSYHISVLQHIRTCMTSLFVKVTMQSDYFNMQSIYQQRREQNLEFTKIWVYCVDMQVSWHDRNLSDECQVAKEIFLLHTELQVWLPLTNRNVFCLHNYIKCVLSQWNGIGSEIWTCLST